MNYFPRKQELDRCLFYNITNPSIKYIYLFPDDKATIDNSFNNLHKIKIITTYQRLKFKQAFLFSIQNFLPNDICIISNADIYFYSDLNKLYNMNLEQTIFCITRYEKNQDGTLNSKWNNVIDMSGCHDTWIYKPKVFYNINLKKYDFPLGFWHCDKVLCRLLQKDGIITKNPMKQIITIHNHASKYRPCNIDINRVYGEHGFVSIEE